MDVGEGGSKGCERSKHTWGTYRPIIKLNMREEEASAI